MRTQPNAPMVLRSPTDILGPEDFARGLLDRDIREIDNCFSAALGSGYAPTVVACDIAYRTDRLAVLDVGCGTLHGAQTLGNEVVRQLSPDIPDIAGKLAVKGVSLHNYSRESMDPQTINAVQGGLYDYIVADAAYMPAVPDNFADFTYAFSAMHYAGNPVDWLQEMLRATRPNGILEFNIADHQTAPDTLLHKYLAMMRSVDFGYDIDEGQLVLYGPDGVRMVDHYLYVGIPRDKRIP